MYTYYAIVLRLVICRPQFTRNASTPSILFRSQLCLFCLRALVPVHQTTSRISEIFIIH